MKNNSSSFGTRLKIAMAQRDTNAASLACALGVSRASVSEWVRGGGISLENLAVIAMELNISIDWLWRGEGNINLFGILSPTSEETALITELRQASASTREALANLLAALASQLYGEDAMQQILALDMLKESGTALCVVSHEGILLDLNDACLSLLGDNLDKENEAIGTHFSEWLGEEDIARAGIQMLKGMQTRHSTHFSCCIRRKTADSSKPFSHVVMSAIFCGEVENGYFQCMLFLLE